MQTLNMEKNQVMAIVVMMLLITGPNYTNSFVTEAIAVAANLLAVYEGGQAVIRLKEFIMKNKDWLDDAAKSVPEYADEL